MGGDGNTANVASVSAVLPLIKKSSTAQASSWDGHVTASALIPAPGTATYSFSGGNLVGSHTIIAEFLAAPLGFASWATTNTAGANLNDDHDNDGVQNGVEYFLGGPSGNTTGFTVLPGVAKAIDGTLSVTWAKGSGYLGVYGTDYVVETSATLTGVWTVETLGGGNITDSSASLKFTFPGGVPYSGKNFARLKVTGP
jgi:hypothetical protein